MLDFPVQIQLVITLIGVVEVHILWAQHQVHHSSEDYNLAVGLRQSVLQGWCGFVSVPLPSSLWTFMNNQLKASTQIRGKDPLID